MIISARMNQNHQIGAGLAPSRSVSSQICCSFPSGPLRYTSITSHSSATKLATVIVAIHPPQKSEGRSATTFLVLEGDTRHGIQPLARRAQRNPDNDQDHECHHQHVTDETEPCPRCPRASGPRPSDCR